MGVRFPSVSTFTLVNPLPANATETIILTTPPLTLPLDNAAVFLGFGLMITAGTGTTALSFKIYRGPALSSPVVLNSVAHTLAAGNSAILGFTVPDSVTGPFAGLQYSVSIVQTGATVAGVINGGGLLAFCL